MPGTLIICSAAGYALALALELLGFRRRFVWRPVALRVLALYALLAHTIHLIKNATTNSALPISTADWLLWAAWLIAIVYFAALFYLPRSPTGIVLLPIALGLMLSSHWANTEPLASGQSLHIWGMVHGLMLLAGTVTVCIGFLAGLMYLAQSYLLKHARSSANGLRLPSLEWLERVNSRTLALSALLIVAAEVFRLVYPAARQGRKVAYLTLASFVFLVIALTSFTLLDTVHGPNRRAASNPQSEIRHPQLPS